MRHPILRKAAIVVAVLAGLAAACSPLDERAVSDREYARGEYQVEFLEFKRRCEEAGGKVFIRARQRIGPDGLPSPGDHYYCDR